MQAGSAYDCPVSILFPDSIQGMVQLVGTVFFFKKLKLQPPSHQSSKAYAQQANHEAAAVQLLEK
jgi:hypothetical protein